MGASNFGRLNNAKHYYVITDERYEMSGLEGIAGDLEYLFKQKGLDFTIDIKYLDNYRELNKISLGRTAYNLKYLNLDIKIEYIIYLKAGYYEHANLDYSYRLFVEGYEVGEYTDLEEKSIFDIVEYIDENIEDFMEDAGINIGLWSIHEKNLENKLEKIDREIRRKIEEVFKEVSDAVLDVCAKFSNGETWYCEVEENDNENVKININQNKKDTSNYLDR